MKREGDWVGDFGHLTLADTALSELLIDILRMLDFGHPSSLPKSHDPGLTTKQAALEMQSVQEKYPRLVPDDAGTWLHDVLNAADERKRTHPCSRAEPLHHVRDRHPVPASTDEEADRPER